MHKPPAQLPDPWRPPAESYGRRLLLRPFASADIDAIAILANDRDIADNTLNIPYPYQREDARIWLLLQQQLAASGDGFAWAITLRDSSKLIGAISLMSVQDFHGEVGYWLGRPFWRQGYATEALQALFNTLFTCGPLQQLDAIHLLRNPASGRVMQKAGMQRIANTCTLDRHGMSVAAAIYSITQPQWQQQHSAIATDI